MAAVRTFLASSFVVVLSVSLCRTASGAEPAAYASHAPMRPLPAAFGRPMAAGPAKFVDAAKGDDKQAGTESAPWKTVAYSLKQLKPGDTLYLRGGTYYENLLCDLAGTKDAPITIRSYPAELAIIDAGFREFADHPASAWEPFAGGAPGEYRSTAAYPTLVGEPGKGGGRRGVAVVGNFADSMIPLHGYHSALDMRANPAAIPAAPPPKGQRAEAAEDEAEPSAKNQPVYCGPGVWYEPESKRIHIRLAHTVYVGLGDGNYTGETDPRRMPLLIGGNAPALRIEKASHVRFQDMVFRGTHSGTVSVSGLRNADSKEIEFDGDTFYGGSPALKVEGTNGLRLVNCALRGVAAPWSSRASMKYRGLSPYLFVAGYRTQRFEIAWSEFTDSHDGLVLGSINGLRFHHNRVDDLNDDGLYLTTGYPAGNDIWIYQNWISRCLSTFSFAGKPAGQEKTEAYIFRNIFDLREPVNRDACAMGSEGCPARTCGDHASPKWKPLMIYQNTFLLVGDMWRSYYGGGLTRGMDHTHRRMFNNIFYHVEGMPKFGFFMSETSDLVVDGNLHWSATEGPGYKGDFLAANRAPQRQRPNWFEESKKTYPPGWTAHDLFADPKFVKVSADWKTPTDLRLQKDSPAIDAGVEIPAAWPDPLRDQDAGKPDIGAAPFDAKPWSVGVRGRLNIFDSAK